MKKAFVFAGMVAVVLCASAIAGEKIDNEEYANWSGFKTGSFVEFESTMKSQGMEMEMTIKWTLVELTEEKAVIETKTTMVVAGNKMEQPASKREVPAKIDAPGEGEAPEAKELDKGEEKLTINGKEYETEWVKTETEQQGTKVTITVWRCDEIPGGTLKMVTKTEGARDSETTMVMSDFKADKK